MSNRDQKLRGSTSGRGRLPNLWSQLGLKHVPLVAKEAATLAAWSGQSIP